jgi:hypothetical protein
MRQIHKEAIILEINGPTIEYDIERLSLWGLKPTVQLLGSYKGKKNPSYLIEIESKQELRRVLDCAKEANQESVLFLDQDRNATLMFIDMFVGDIELGRLVAVSEEEAKKEENWTFNPVTGVYYITKK